ncbi:MAG: EAL domain-containing protein, partial [Micromonosporaceae bacterium]|nr:EAL domain-containing protein [Micromonosporaceae bacterium]
PQDMAVVGFDDMEMAPYLSPSLSSVRQPFESIGHRAVSLLLRQLDGEDVATERHYVATSFVARESCGCSGPTALPVVTADARSQGESPDRLIAGLIDRLTTTLLPGTEMVDLADRAVLAGATEEIASALDTVVAGAPAPDGMRVRQSLDALYRLRPRPESLLEIVAAVRDYGRCAAAFHAAAGSGTSETETMLRVEECTHDMILGLSQSQARGLLSNTIYVHNTMDTQYEVSMGLLRSHEEDPRDLRWLRCTTMRAGCLGLWRDGVAPAGAPVLTIAGTFTRDGLAPALPEGDRDVGAFPPREMLALAGEAPEDVVFVARVKINESDWGMLATVGAIEGSTLTGREAANEWAALLTVALNHDAVLAKQREQEARLHRAAFYDSLTGLPNRTLFLDQLRPLLGRSKRRSDYRFGVLVIDLDEFKVINDSLGHATGDQILVKAAERIGAGLREVDTVARFGGDEFAVLLDGIEEWCGIGAVAERLHAALAAPFVIDGQEVVITASIGITLSSTGYECAEDVLRDADIAMNCAKSREKGSHAVFDVEMHARAVNRLQTAADLRRALQEGGLELHYQPIVDLKTGARLAFEALIRWRHPTNGLLSPGAFLQIAEQTGLIVPIGRWTIVEVCRQIREWRQTSPFGERVRVSFNVSNKQFWHDSLLGDLDTALREAGLSPQCLSMEITEGVVMSNVDAACKILQTLHDWGIELHVDDFGTGYSSLEVLHQLPIDALKIDRSFISRLGIDRRSAELVRTIVLMADNLGLDLIAEGIETREQRDRLRQLGAAYGQGYWFSRPVPGDAAGALIWDAGVPAAGVR